MPQNLTDWVHVSTATTLVIHFIGAHQDQELLAVTKYEEMFHLLPNLKSLTIVLVGPELHAVHHSVRAQCHGLYTVTEFN